MSDATEKQKKTDRNDIVSFGDWEESKAVFGGRRRRRRRREMWQTEPTRTNKQTRENEKKKREKNGKENKLNVVPTERKIGTKISFWNENFIPSLGVEPMAAE